MKLMKTNIAKIVATVNRIPIITIIIINKGYVCYGFPAPPCRDRRRGSVFS